MPDFSEIKTKFQGEVNTSAETLNKYSRDASIFEIRPQAVAYPKDLEDVKNLVAWVTKNKERDPALSITARCAGTDMGGGAINESIIADFTRYFNRIEMFGPGFAVVEPGVFYRDFESESLKRGLILPCYTASKSLNTMGGMAANNSAGEKSLVYGQAKDYVLELETVLADGQNYHFGELTEAQLEEKIRLPNFEGQIYRQMYQLLKDNFELIQKAKPITSKNAAGYYLWEVWDGKTFNLAKLLAGSQGTLGLITKIKYHLVRYQSQSGMLVMFLEDLSMLGELVSEVLRFKPETFESYDNHTFKLALKYLPDMLKKMFRGAESLPGRQTGGSAGKVNLFKMAWQFLPELWLVLSGGVPKLVLIAEFTGNNQTEINQRLKQAQAAVSSEFLIKTHITQSPQEAEKYWTIRRESFNLLRQHSRGLATAPFIDDIIVPTNVLPEFLPKLERILQKYPKLIYTIAGHVGNGNFHIIPLMDLAKAENRELIPRLAEEVYDLVLSYRGSLTAEHNDGLIRTPFLEKMYGPEMIKLFEQTKFIFDPQNIFNPRKKVYGDLAWAMRHIKQTND